MIKSVSYLTNLLIENRNEKWGIGPLGHGLHALALYDERDLRRPARHAGRRAGRSRKDRERSNGKRRKIRRTEEPKTEASGLGLGSLVLILELCASALQRPQVDHVQRFAVLGALGRFDVHRRAAEALVA